MDLDIENKGYDEVEVGTFNWRVIIDNVEYEPAGPELEDPLDDVTLRDGSGSNSGQVAFEVPSETDDFRIDHVDWEWDDRNLNVTRIE